MNDKSAISIHWSFWLIAIIGLIWNILGTVNFFTQMNPDVIESYRETERLIITHRPFWATLAFAVAVMGGAAGSILLLRKRLLAVSFFAFSLMGVVVSMIYTLSLDISFSPGEIAGIIAMPLVVAAFLLWYSKWLVRKGWIK